MFYKKQSILNIMVYVSWKIKTRLSSENYFLFFIRFLKSMKIIFLFFGLFFLAACNDFSPSFSVVNNPGGGTPPTKIDNVIDYNGETVDLSNGYKIRASMNDTSQTQILGNGWKIDGTVSF